jgi:hypothetical protein
VFSAHVDPGNELADAVGEMAVGQFGEGFGQPRVRVDAAKFAVLDEGGDHRPVISTFVGTGEECIFPVQRDRADAAFNGIAVEVDAAIVEEAAEAIPAGERIVDGVADLGLGADLPVPGFEILAQLIDMDAAAFLTHSPALFGRQAANVRFDDIEQGDAAQHLDGERRLVLQLVKFATHMMAWMPPLDSTTRWTIMLAAENEGALP